VHTDAESAQLRVGIQPSGLEKSVGARAPLMDGDRNVASMASHDSIRGIQMVSIFPLLQAATTFTKEYAGAWGMLGAGVERDHLRGAH